MKEQILSSSDIKALFPDFVTKVQNKVKANEQHEAWLLQRRGKFTASTFHKMFTKKLALASGKVTESYIYEKVAETIGAYNESWGSKATAWGIEHEQMAIRAYEDYKSVKVEQPGFVLLNEDVGCTPDGIVENSKPKKIVQFKCPYTTQNHVKYLCYKTAEDMKLNSPEYYLQINFEMYVTKAAACDFVSFDKRFPFQKQLHILEVQRDVELIEKIKEAIQIAQKVKREVLEKI